MIKPKKKDYVTWYFVFRAGKTPVVSFPTREIAEDWIRDSPFRSKDTIAARRIFFSGSLGYSSK